MTQIIRDMLEISRCGVQYRSDNLAQFGLKSIHASYLTEICANPGISQDRLARIICINKSNVARQVAVLEEDGVTQEVKSLPDLLEAIRARGRKGMSIYRFQGLGEMDADELYDTTMDPTKRHMLRVKLSDAVKADQMFSLLMGDEVEPRRKFIEDNALNVRSLDI